MLSSLYKDRLLMEPSVYSEVAIFLLLRQMFLQADISLTALGELRAIPAMRLWNLMTVFIAIASRTSDTQAHARFCRVAIDIKSL